MPRGAFAHWSLDPDITFLNHGSFGACPRVVLEAQMRLRHEMEREPVLFLARKLEAALDETRSKLAAFVGADAAGLVFVPNATTGVSTVLRSLELRAGDEIVVTNHGYPACTNAARFVAERASGRVVVANIPFPLAAEVSVVEAILGAVTPNTRLALIDHVTSPTGLVFPVARVVRELAARGIDVLVDGAHAPGMVPLDLGALGAAYYTGNCHKWLCAPKGAAFLHVREDRRREMRPLVISHGASSERTDRSRFLLEFDWTGSVDPTPWLVVPAAIDFLSGLIPGGMAALMAANRDMALRARACLMEALGVDVAPAPECMIGTLAAVPLPAHVVGRADLEAEALHAALFQRFHIEVPIVPWGASKHPLVRVSAQAYNVMSDYDRLSEALVALIAFPSPTRH